MPVIIGFSPEQIMIGAWGAFYVVILVLSSFVVFSQRLHFGQRARLFVGTALLVPVATVVLFLPLGVSPSVVGASCLAEMLFLGVGIWDFYRRRSRAERMWQNPAEATHAEFRAIFSFGGVLVVTAFYELYFLVALTTAAYFVSIPSLVIHSAWYMGVLGALVLSWRFYKQLQALRTEVQDVS